MGRLAIRLLALAGAVALLGGAVVAWFVFSGRYNVAASVPHTAPVRLALETVYEASVRHHAPDVARLEESAADQVEAGARFYAGHCARCHGEPGGERPSFTEG